MSDRKPHDMSWSSKTIINDHYPGMLFMSAASHRIEFEIIVINKIERITWSLFHGLYTLPKHTKTISLVAVQMYGSICHREPKSPFKF